VCLRILAQSTKNTDVCSHFNYTCKCLITFTRLFKIKLCMKHYRVFRFCVEETAGYMERSCEYWISGREHLSRDDPVAWVLGLGHTTSRHRNQHVTK
jgi:hypothetical protein